MSFVLIGCDGRQPGVYTTNIVGRMGGSDQEGKFMDS
jgi:hypothetical protein